MDFLFHFNGISYRNAISHWKRIWQFFFHFALQKKVSIWRLITQYATLTKGKKKKLCYYQKELVARYFYSIFSICYLHKAEPIETSFMYVKSTKMIFSWWCQLFPFYPRIVYIYTTRIYGEKNMRKKLLFSIFYLFAHCVHRVISQH